jgi:hypothetical protein
MRRVAWLACLSLTITLSVGTTWMTPAVALQDCYANFTEIKIPKLGGQARLHDVALASGLDAWVVGDDGSHAVVLHWSGQRWTRDTLPTLSGTSIASGVVAISVSEAWAVGSYADGTKALLLHWDGATWTKIAAPAVPGASAVSLLGVGAAGGNDIWAVGTADVTGGSIPVTMHFDGLGWSLVSYPASGSPEWLNDVITFGGSTAWLVGHGTPGGSAGEIGTWNGSAWANDFAGLDMQGIAATSTSDVWAVGDALGTGYTKTWAAHWNGSSWSYGSAVNPGTGGHAFEGAASATNGQVWAVGEYNNQGPDRALAELEANGSWTWVPTPNVGKQDTRFEAIDTALDQTYAVGSSWNRAQTALVEQICPISIGVVGPVPQTAVADPGGTVVWQMQPGAGSHSLVDSTFGDFDSGVLSTGGVYTARFDGAGKYTITDTAGGGWLSYVWVLMHESRASGAVGKPLTLTWAAKKAASPRCYDVQVEKPGATSWRAWATCVASPDAPFTPTSKGTYRFRARVRSTLGPSTGYSPPISFTAG